MKLTEGGNAIKELPMELTTREENIRFAKSVKRIVYFYHPTDETQMELVQPKGEFIKQLEAMPEGAPFRSTLLDVDTLSLGHLVRR